MAEVVIRFWAGAQRAAGHAEESMSAASVGEVRDALCGRRELEKICAAASFLVDGERASDATALRGGEVVDVLPPFAGG